MAPYTGFIIHPWKGRIPHEEHEGLAGDGAEEQSEKQQSAELKKIVTLR